MNRLRSALGSFVLSSGLLLALSACGGAADPTPPPFEFRCDVAAAIARSSTTTPVSGRVPLAVTLASKTAGEGRVKLAYSLDGESWSAATTVGSTEGLAVSPEGTEHALAWDSLADLGPTQASGVRLRAIPYLTCGPGTPAELAPLEVDNRAPACGVRVTLDPGPLDGRVRVPFVVAHPQGLPVDVKAEYSRDDGATYATLTLTGADCNEDGEADLGRSLSTAPEGVAACLEWDSQADVAADAEVRVRLSCFVANEPQGAGTSAPVLLLNDPRPGAEELVFTELSLSSAFPAGRYFEVQNRTRHTLNLQGLSVRRWAAGQNVGSSPARNAFEVRDPSGVLPLEPGAFGVFAGSDDLRATGCVRADVVWPASFAFNDDSTYRLVFGDELVAELSIVDDAVWNFEEGVSLALDPEKSEGPERGNVASWCPEASIIPACEGVDAPERGTPGRANSPCGRPE